MKHKLLVAEDISHERASLVNILQKHLGNSLSILEARDGKEAWTLYQRENPEILVLNIEMPFLSGLDVARKVREENKSCAILFISDFDNFSYARQAIALRALDYILKPYDETKLILAVKDAVQYVTQHSAPHDTHPVTFALSAHPSDDNENARIALVREDILSFIEQHYMEELSMKNAATAMNYSDAYFCKLFKQCFHVNFSTYLNEFRIRKALTLMENPRINVKEISLACGYTDPNYFSRVFRRFTGQTPTEYRLSIMEKALQNQ